VALPPRMLVLMTTFFPYRSSLVAFASCY
jgi:hypothetical protein